MPTTNPVPSQDPSDLLFNAGKLDEAINSTSQTYTDRRGVQRRTLAGLEAEFPNAQANAVAAAAAAVAAADSAVDAANEATSAATAVGLAFNEATAAQAARTGAEAARDAAQLSAGVYATTAAGLAATVSGSYFSVPSADSAEYLILYLNNAGTAVEQKRYPAASAVASIQEAARNAIYQANQFSRAHLLAQVLPSIQVSGSVSASSVSGIPTVRLLASAISTPVRYAWRFARGLVQGGTVSMSMVVAQGNAGAGTSSSNYVRLTYRNAAGSQIGTKVAGSLGTSAITSPTVFEVAGSSIPEDCAFIDVDVSAMSDAATPRELHIRGMYLGAGSSSFYRNPDEAATINENISALQTSDAAQTAEINAMKNSISALPSPAAVYMGVLNQLPADVAAKTSSRAITIKQRVADASFEIAERNEANISANKTTYYFSPGGNNSNSGLTRELPKKSIGAFLSALAPTTDIEIVLIDNGLTSIYYRSDSLSGVNWNHPYHLSIVADTEALVTTAQPGLTWTAEGSAWRASRTFTGNVFDASLRDFRGIPYRLRLAGSVAEVQAQAGTWYTDGTLVYVRTHDSRTPDSNILVMVTGPAFICNVNAGKTVFFNNIKFCHYNSVTESVLVKTNAGDTGYLTEINCAHFGAGRNGLSTELVTRVFSRNCTAAHNGYDGFNYHDSPGASQSVAVEVDCVAYENGIVGGIGNSNGSTAHDGMTVLRSGGLYFRSNGPVVADVNGCLSYNINCMSAASALSGAGASVASWYFDNASAVADGETWLVACASHDSLYDISSPSGVKINVRGWRGAAPALGASTVLTKY